MKTQSYHAFWQRLHHAAEKDALPLRMMFEVTYGCNFKCRHCYVPASYRRHYAKSEIGTREACSVLDQLKEAGCFYLGFTGGEPFLRKDIMQVLKHAAKCGFEIIINTNGSLITEETAGQLKDLYLNKVDITLPAMSEGAFAAVTGVRGARKKVFGAVELLRKNGIPLGFKTCLLEENKSEIEDIQDFAASCGALHRLDDKLLPRLNGSRQPFAYRARQSLRPYAPDVECGTRDFFSCGIGLTQAAITPAGELKMCVMFDHPKYNILDKGPAGGFQRAWDRLKRLAVSMQFPDGHRWQGAPEIPDSPSCPAIAWLKGRAKRRR